MKYTKETFKELVDQRIAEKGDKKVVNYIWTLIHKKNDEELKNFIYNDNVTFGDTLKQRIYNIYYGVEKWPECPVCGKKVKFVFFNSGYKKTCSDKCTCILRYGSRSSLANKEVREKARETMKKRYGDIYQKTQEYKDKVVSTNMKRYGAKHIMCTDDGIKKAHDTQIEKYGMLYQQTKEFHDLASQQYKEKNKAEKMAKGQRDASYKRLKEYANNEGFDLLFSIDEYHAEHNFEGKWNYYDFKCRNCGFEFSIMLGNIDRDGLICPHCQKVGKSKIQHKLLLEIRKNHPNYTFLEDYNKILDNRQEIDIYCKERNLGIEYNGNCWHAQKFNNKKYDYHIGKYKNFFKNNVDVISFWSDEFEKRRNVVNSIIDSFLDDQQNQLNKDIVISLCHDEMDVNQLFLTLVESKDRVAMIYKDSLIGAIKFKVDEDNIEINDLVNFEQFDFKYTICLFHNIYKDKKLKFNLDNRLMGYYKKWIPKNYSLVDVEEPKFYKLRKGRSLKEYDKENENSVDFSKEDIIWTYGRSIFQLK